MSKSNFSKGSKYYYRYALNVNMYLRKNKYKQSNNTDIEMNTNIRYV